MGERIGDTVKFQSVTMALWIKNGWRMPAAGLKQWMWNTKRDMIDPYELTINVFGPKGVRIRDQCIKFYRFQSFLAAFPSITLLYLSVCMPTIDWIKCQRERKTEAYAFVSSMFNESSLAGNQLVFEDLNIVQMGIEKDDDQWNNWLTIWWGNQKTEA